MNCLSMNHTQEQGVRPPSKKRVNILFPCGSSRGHVLLGPLSSITLEHLLAHSPQKVFNDLYMMSNYWSVKCITYIFRGKVSVGWRASTNIKVLILLMAEAVVPDSDPSISYGCFTLTPNHCRVWPLSITGCGLPNTHTQT